MLKTLDRYVIREVLPPFILALLVFTFVLALPPIMDQLEQLVAKGVPWGTAGYMILLLVPQALGLTIPMAFLVGVLIGLGRLSTDRESVAILACGISPYRLLRPIGLLSLAATAATMYVMIAAIPDANQRFREISFDIISQKVETDVRPRVFFDDFPNWVLYPRDEAPPGEPGWKDVLVADTSRPGATTLFLAERALLVLDRDKRTVDLVLTNGAQYAAAVEPGETQVSRFPDDYVIRLDPDQVFPSVNLTRGVPEMTIPQLREQIATKVAAGVSPHNEIMAIHAKFSIPAACLVFALIGLALGLTVARDGKLGAFVVGISVIFAYYVAMFVAEAAAKGHWIPAEIARWVPNLVLGPFGAVALVWRAWHIDGRLPFRIPDAWWAWTKRIWKPRRAAESAQGSAAARRPGRRVIVVVRVPRAWVPMPGLIDRYVSRIYVRVIGLSFFALLGLFYISTFIDRSDKVFKGQATTSMVGTLLLYMTPQFVYFVIPIAALLSVLVTFGVLTRSSELTVMKACGVSIYRVALPVAVLSLALSGVLFGLEQQVMAQANRRAEILDAQIRGGAPQVMSAINRVWVAGRNGAIYHYGLFDADRAELIGLRIYQPKADGWELASETYVRRATYEPGGWVAHDGWVQDFTKQPPTWTPFTRGALPALEPPDYFATEQPVAEMMTVGQLRTYIAELAASGFNVVSLEVDLQQKLAFPFVTFVMTLLAVPFGVSLGRRGTLYGIGLGIVIALTYWIVMSAFVAIGKGGLLPPVLAAWAPNILVAGTAGYLLLTTRT